ncbi:MAG: regulator of amino acid metabolism, contains ACT domain protein [Methanomicrobiales archaeon]|nr:regulator of amino acid metabolism, contains ACT domain protein [Methanomicrobiales archaeon]MDD1669152.1 regulator of amino acid metabolism, contains ACT domain protein [Methanomicrobiales archaeon]
MWSLILKEFADSPAQTRVAKFLLENGFGLNDDGKVVANGVEIPATHIAAVIGTDRRVVDATARRILSLESLAPVFRHMRATPDLSRVAEALGLSAFTILPKNAQEKGIVSAVMRVVSGRSLTIRQIFVTDPYFSEEPKLVVIIDGKIPRGLVEEIRALPQVKQIII